MDDLSLRKLPPQAVDIEQSILSSLLIYPEKSIETLESILQPSDFYRSSHKKIYETMLDMHSFDLPTLVNKMREKNILEDTGGAAYLVKLMDTVPIASNLERYAMILKEKALLRNTIEVCNYSMGKCFENNENPVQTVDDIQRSIFDISIDIKESSIQPASVVIDDVINKMENPDKSEILKTGFPTLDYMLNIQGGKLIIVAGRPSMGKSSFKRNVLSTLAKAGIKSANFTLEMDKKEEMTGLLAQETGIETMRLNNPENLTPGEWKVVVKHSGEIWNWPILFDDSSPMQVNELRRKCRKMVKDGCKIIFIDQLNKLKSGLKLDRFAEATECTIEVCQMANELKVPIILLAQINRDLEKRSDKRPVLSDLKNTGSLEEEADSVLLLFRPFYYTKAEEDRETGEIVLAKNRAGKTGLITCNWHEKRMLFLERYQK